MDFFQTPNTNVLRGRGLDGDKVFVTFCEGALDLRGETGGLVRIAPADIARMRVGYLDAKRRTYEVRIWLIDSTDDIRLTPLVSTWATYARIIWVFSESLVKEGYMDRIEGGYSKFDALLAPTLFGLLTAAAMAIALFALTNEPWWGRLIVPAFPLAFFVLFVHISITRSWPRRIGNLRQLTVQLPPI